MQDAAIVRFVHGNLSSNCFVAFQISFLKQHPAQHLVELMRGLRWRATLRNRIDIHEQLE